jgi:hypothetical protein
MSSWSCDQQVCATCRYWCGKRDIEFMANFFNAMAEKGKCADPSGNFRGIYTYEGTSCSDWEAFGNEK